MRQQFVRENIIKLNQISILLASLFLFKGSSAQSIDTAQLCLNYENKIMIYKSGIGHKLSCNQIVELTNVMNIQDTTFSGVRNTLIKFSNINLLTMPKGDFAPGMDCTLNKATRKPMLNCKFDMLNSPSQFSVFASSMGNVEKTIFEVSDVHQIISPIIESIKVKKKLDRITPDMEKMLIQILVDKNNAIAPIEETYRVSGKGISVEFINIPKNLN